MKTTAKQIAMLLLSVVIFIAIAAHAAAPGKGAAPVTIENTPSDPVPVIPVGPTRQPFQTWLQGAFSSSPLQINFTVPSDKRMVIELITIQGGMSSEMQLQDLWVSTTVANPLNSNAVPHRLKVPSAFPQIATPTSLLFNADYSVRFYADPGTVVRLFLFAGSSAFGTGSAQVTFSGYLMPLDSPSLAP